MRFVGDDTPHGLPSNKPVVVVMTPNNDALFNKWIREAETFKTDCARNDAGLEWLQILSPIEDSSKSGNLIHLSAQIKEATRSRPVLLIAKQTVFGAALHDRDLWRRRSLAALFGNFGTSNETRRYWCRKEKCLITLGFPNSMSCWNSRSSGPLWDDPISMDLKRAYARALTSNPLLTERCSTALSGSRQEPSFPFA